MAFSLFLFTSLAFVKRYAELNRLADEERTRTAGRGYQVTDLAFLQNAGIASGFLSVLVLAQYINSDAMKIHYSNPWALWLMCPLMLYWICRLWLLANRKEMSEDPVVFAVRDVTSIAIALLAGGLLWLASVPL
jgi:4-hydroxybenzoate polyprenyltransferase